MPQEFQVLQCFSCETFQVNMVKKVTKWSCKMCGEKQSTKKIHSRETGKECRVLVQSLNEQRLTQCCSESKNVDDYRVASQPRQMTLPCSGNNSKWSESVANRPEDDEAFDKTGLTNQFNVSDSKNKKSKWAEFIQNCSEEVASSDATDLVDCSDTFRDEGTNGCVQQLSAKNVNDSFDNIFEDRDGDFELILNL